MHGHEVDYERHGNDGRTSQLLRVQWEKDMKKPLGLELDSESPHYEQQIQCATEEEGRRLDASRPSAYRAVSVPLKK